MSDTAHTRVAIVSHGHPELSPGGAEYASYALFRRLKARRDTQALFVARAEPAQLGHGGAFASFRGRRDEILWSPPRTDAFRLISTAPDTLRDQVIELHAYAAPDVVHLHHYFGIGVDILRLLREELEVPVVLTLHELLAICNHHGQMVKTGGALCHAASPAECSACFPHEASAKFFLRKELILEHFSYVDRFICPSKFLARRYVDWGLEAERIRVIENPLSPGNAAVSHLGSLQAQPGGQTLRLGFFGQFTPFKGIDVLLDAMAVLPPSVRSGVRLTLHGVDLQRQDSQTRRRISDKLAALADCVANFGPYGNDDVVALMQAVDWAVVPSTWWENSPLVIQEARLAGVPVLCSNIGGMREKVRPGIDGAHFIVGSSVDLAEKIAAIAAGRLAVRAEPAPLQPAAMADIVECYRAAIAGGSEEAAAAPQTSTG